MGDNTTSYAVSQEGTLEKFVERLMTEKRVPQSEQKVSDAIITEILMNLPDYLLDKINAAYDDNRGSVELIEGIVKESGVDTKQIVEKTLSNFREEYLA